MKLAWYIHVLIYWNIVIGAFRASEAVKVAAASIDFICEIIFLKKLKLKLYPFLKCYEIIMAGVESV